MTRPDIDRLREELFLSMVRARSGAPQNISDEEAQLLGEHAARLARGFLDGSGYFDRTGHTRDPRPPEIGS
ncbi:MAG TPA: hypothetical protein VF384_02165 [Planctomycetota bacterium]